MACLCLLDRSGFGTDGFSLLVSIMMFWSLMWNLFLIQPKSCLYVKGIVHPKIKNIIIYLQFMLKTVYPVPAINVHNCKTAAEISLLVWSSQPTRSNNIFTTSYLILGLDYLFVQTMEGQMIFWGTRLTTIFVIPYSLFKKSPSTLV